MPRVMQHILRRLLLKFHKILLFTMKVIHKKLRGSAIYGPPCIMLYILNILISAFIIIAIIIHHFFSFSLKKKTKTSQSLTTVAWELILL